MENQTTVYPSPVHILDKFLGIFAVFGGIMGVILAYFGGDVNGERSDYLRFYCNEGLVLFLFGLAGAVFQLYADFSGCMDIALGVSEVFGITLEENFRSISRTPSLQTDVYMWQPRSKNLAAYR